MHRTALLIATVAGVLGTAGVGHAAPCQSRTACDASCGQRCADVEQPSAVTLDGKQLCLNGMGLREATVFNVNVYLAALYVETRGADGEKLASSQQLKLMRLRFLRDVSRGDISEAISTSFKRSAGAALPRLAKSIERLTASLPELKEGDTLTLVYRPDRGLELSHKKKLLVMIPGAEFATALFRIWLGSHPPNEGLRTGLLGGRCE